jgi:hypothetical protein
VSAISSEAGILMMPESAQIRGSHHCIGTARMVADLIFEFVHSQAIANGGMISAEDILSAKAQFVLSLPVGIDVFEKINRECMHASGSAAPDPFSRDNILSTLLSACGKGSAEYAFNFQIDRCGPSWLSCFFQGLSQVARKNISEESWGDLITAYVHAAEIYKANMHVFDVIARNDVKATLSDCIAPLYKMFESDEIAKSTSAEINNVIARKYNVTGPSIVKITDDQMKRFLTMLLKEMSLRLHPPVTGNQKYAAC